MALRIAGNLPEPVVRLRHWFYDRQLFRICHPAIPVLSVGSVTIGGAGKTPLTLKLAGLLQQKGLKPAILSRGYGRKTRGLAVIPTGAPAEGAAREFGDEPMMIRQHFPDLPIVVSEDRCSGAEYIEKQGLADCIVLDDGFQHRHLAHDCDVLIFKKNFQGVRERYFPVGHLRDSLTRLAAADSILYEKGTAEDVTAYLQGKSGCFAYQFHFQGPEPSDLTSPVTAFSGVADPSGFRQTLTELALRPDHFFAFPDHAEYRSFRLKKLDESASGTLLCTEKDYVKLPREFLRDRDVRCIRMSVEIENETEFMDSLLDRIQIR